MVNKWATFAILVFFCFFLALPYFWMISTAFKPLEEVAAYPPHWLPRQPTLNNFALAWQAAPFGRFTLNSVISAGISCVLQIFFALLMGYAFAFLKFPAKRFLFMAVIATMLIPEEAKLIPNYTTILRLGWMNTYTALIIPTVAHAFPVFVLFQWFRSLPRDLIEAAKVDGASHWQTLWQVVVPASRAVVLVLTLYSFVNRWNDYLWALVVTDKLAMRTLPIGLAYLKGTQEGGNQWNLLMATALFATLPLVLLFLVTQKLILQEVQLIRKERFGN